MKLLIVEDEKSLLQSIIDYFTEEGYLCEGATTHPEGLQKMQDFQYDCIILDINLPGGSGLELLQFLRKQKKDDGVVIISARGALGDKIAGLNSGADDYLSKPFHLSELNARVKALMRRKYSAGSNTLEAGTLKIDLQSKSVSCNNQPLILTKNELDILIFMCINKGRVVSKQSIAEHIYGVQADGLPSFDFVYSQMKNLKRKLKDKGSDDLIQTVYGLGYKLMI